MHNIRFGFQRQCSNTRRGGEVVWGRKAPGYESDRALGPNLIAASFESDYLKPSAFEQFPFSEKCDVLTAWVFRTVEVVDQKDSHLARNMKAAELGKSFTRRDARLVSLPQHQEV